MIETETRKKEEYQNLTKRIKEIKRQLFDGNILLKLDEAIKKATDNEENLFLETLNKTPLAQEKQKEKEERKKQKEVLQQKIKELEEQKKQVRINAIIQMRPQEMIDETMQFMDKEIETIKNEMENLNNDEDFSEFVARIPEIIIHLHKHLEKGLIEGENEEQREEIKKLMELTLHKLTLTNKKALKIRLFETLENGFFDEN